MKAKMHSHWSVLLAILLALALSACAGEAPTPLPPTSTPIPTVVPTGSPHQHSDPFGYRSGHTNRNARTAHCHTNQSAAYRDGSAIAHTAPFYSCRSTQVGSATRRTSTAN